MIQNASLVSPLAWTTDESAANQVQVWQAALDGSDADQIAALTVSLDAAERERAARFRFERDQRRYTVTRGILRHLLGAELEVPAVTVAFVYGPQGKPSLAVHFQQISDRGELCFNVTHSGGWALFALAWNRPVGIDLEAGERLAARDPDELASLAARVLSPRELTVWQNLPAEPPAVRGAAFLRAWTRKEAYAKATGRGIFTALDDQIEVALDAAQPAPTLLFPGGAWSLHDLPGPTVDCSAALAMKIR